MGTTYHPKLSIIKIENLRLRALIGFMPWETEKLQDLVISYSFKYDNTLASDTDDIQHAIDYKKITKEIINFVDQKSFNLIETVAENIYTHLQNASAKLQEINVRVEKPHALRFADNVMIQIEGKDRYQSVIVALGSNINAEENLEKSLTQLQQFGFIMQRTAFIKTKPLKFESQPEFLNGAILLHTQKSLSELKMHLNQIEALLGRVRTENKNAPREIDLDVISYNGFLIDENITDFPFLVDFVHQLKPEFQFENTDTI